MRYYTDGACKNNGQFGKQEAHIAVADDTGKIIIFEPVGDKTNIEAEALALIACFKYLRDNNIKHAQIITDSKFWHDAIHKHWRLKVERLYPLRDELYALFDSGIASLIWMYREYNKAGHFLEEKFEKKWNNKGDRPHCKSCTCYASK